jgi:hypothetical protein
VNAEVLLVDEELHVEAIGAAVDVPVHVAEVVTDAVGAVVRELDALTLAGAAPLALDPSPERPAGGEREPLELRQELGGEEVRPRGGGHA